MKKLFSAVVSGAILLTLMSGVANAMITAADPAQTSGSAVTLTGFQKSDGTVELTWGKYTGTDFRGYKVVHSTTVEAPVYPDDGYLTYITDLNSLSYIHNAVKTGKNYYRICVINATETLCGNTVTITSSVTLGGDTAPVADTYSDDATITLTLTAVKNADSDVELNWTKYEAGNLKWYKVVRSITNQMPYYPNDGYIEVKNYAAETSYVDKTPLVGTNYYRVCVITTENKRGCSNVVPLVFDTAGEMPFISNFPDTEGHWAVEYINKLAQAEIVSGINGNFMPENNVLRSEATKMMMYAYDFKDGVCDSTIFSDVRANDWFCAVVTKAKEKGIIAGENGKFLPGRNLTRAEAVKILIEIRGDKMAMVSVDPFTDVNKDAWYAKYVYHAKRLGIISGVDGKFQPDRFITRAELAKIISIAMDTAVSE